MIKSVLLSAVTALALSTSGAVAAGGGDQHIVDFDFSFEGPFGKFDQMQLQRGLQVYTEVCSACHGLRYIPIRTLHDAGGPGLPEDQVRAYAAQNFEIFDADLDDYRPATPVDHFPVNDGARCAGFVFDGKGAGWVSWPIWLWHQPVFQRYGGTRVYSISANGVYR